MRIHGSYGKLVMKKAASGESTHVRLGDNGFANIDGDNAKIVEIALKEVGFG